MDGFTLLAVLGGLLIVAGVFTRKIWQVTVRPFYRNPDAIEPSSAGFAVRALFMIAAGVIFLGVGISQGKSEKEADHCSDITDEVGEPTSLDDAEDAIRRATSSEEYSVESEESTDEHTVAGMDNQTTITTTKWTVSANGKPIARFTWSETDSDSGYSQEDFRATPCSRVDRPD